MTDLRLAHASARALAHTVLGHDPGPMTPAESSYHYVYVSPEAVVKIITADDHSRLDRELALAPHLPAGLSAPVLGSGVHQLETRAVRCACYANVPGAAPGIGMPGVDAATARRLAEQAIQRLEVLHAWVPHTDAEPTVREPL